MPYHTFAVSHIYFIIQLLHKKVNRHNFIVFCRTNAGLYAFYIKRPPERRSCGFMLLVGLRLILAVVMQHSCSLMRFLFNVHLRVGFIYIIVYMEL